jgi:hypothetical protein
MCYTRLTPYYVEGCVVSTLTFSFCPSFKYFPKLFLFHLRKSATRTLNFSEIVDKESPLRTTSQSNLRR